MTNTCMFASYVCPSTTEEAILNADKATFRLTLGFKLLINSLSLSLSLFIFFSLNLWHLATAVQSHSPYSYYSS